jgi:predicted nucleic acid-binding protein
LPSNILIDADVLFSYLVSDELSSRAEKLLERADRGLLKLRAASEIYDDIITALRTESTGMRAVTELLSDLRTLPHEPLPTTLDVASEAMTLYAHYGGARRLHYFDSFHVATAKVFDLPLVTSDRFILENKEKLGIAVLDLRKI